MHSFLSRFNALFTFLSSVLAAATVLVFLQTLFVNYTVPVDIKVENVKLKSIRDYANSNGMSDVSTAAFTLSGDLTPIVNWNVRLVYVWLQVDYETEGRPLNSLILWDKYYDRFKKTIIKERILKPRFPFMDDGVHLRNRNVTFSLHWTIVPNAGWLRNVEGEGSRSIVLPDNYNW